MGGVCPWPLGRTIPRDLGPARTGGFNRGRKGRIMERTDRPPGHPAA